jgi:hypothetical protein
MKSREKRLQRLELARQRKTGGLATWEEFCLHHDFSVNFRRIYPDPDTAPKFLQRGIPWISDD